MLARCHSFVASASTAASAPLVGENTTAEATTKDAPEATITVATAGAAAKAGSAATAGTAAGTAASAGAAANNSDEVRQFSVTGDDVATSRCALLSAGDLLVVCVDDFFGEHEEGGAGV